MIKYQQMSTEISQKIPKKFICIFCDYITCNKKDFNKHTTTVKHKTQLKSTNINKKSPNVFICNCGKNYKERSGLWRHKKICKENNEEQNKNNNNEISRAYHNSYIQIKCQ